MTKIKKTVEQLPFGLEREFISLSKSEIWNEAVKEWELKNYYYVSGYKLCPYSSVETHSLCILVNKINSKEIEICSFCAKLYFGISEGNLLESAVSKIRRNNKAGMGEDALNYLMKHGIINSIECKDYWKDIPFDDDDDSLELEDEMNRRLINFTDYENKNAFDKINLILAWASDNREWSLGYIANLKFNLLHFELVDMRYLDDVIRKKSIDEKYCDYKKQKAGMQLLWEYFNSISIKRLLPPKYIKRSIPECEKIVIVEDDIENDIRFEVEDFDQLVGDVWDKPVSLYMSEDTLDSIARITEGWGRIAVGCEDYSLIRLVHFGGFKELLNIYRENPGIDSFRDYVDLLSMRQIDTMFNQFVIVTFNRFPAETLIQELNNIFSKEGIRVRYSDLDLRFISMI